MLKNFPRLPLEGNVDLTYRCNSACRHCWLRLPVNAPEQKDELTFSELRRIADEARCLGCRQWNISGGEPLVRTDFAEIFDYLTRKAVSYSLNTNGTLITPGIARLLKRKGVKMVALYGATAEVYDDVTRHPGGFDAAMRGFAYLREAGAGFIVQVVPLRSNWHQWGQMQELAKSLSPHWRVGASWLHLSSDGKPGRNGEICGQRLDPCQVIGLDPPDMSYDERMAQIGEVPAEPVVCGRVSASDDRLFAACIARRRDFHLDHYGGMSFCSFIKDPALRYDMRRGIFQEAWEEFIPSLGEKVRGGQEYLTHCGSCEKRADCRWCGVYAYLETGRYSAPVPYLCGVAEEAGNFKAQWQARHRRYFKIAGITVRVESDLDFETIPFKKEFSPFAVGGPGDDNVTLRHYFELPDLKGKDLGVELYRKAPWAISNKNGTWFYKGISTEPDDKALHRVAVFTHDYTHATIYSPPGDAQRIGAEGWPSLSLFPTDQIWLGPLLADRSAVLLHSAGVILQGQGLLFVGHSSAGKSTTMTLLKNATAETAGWHHLPLEILCDDRNIVRHWDAGWRVHGTWSHGDVSDVSSSSAPLRAILFLQKDRASKIVPLTDRKEIWKRLLATLIRPMVTAQWWQKELDVLERIVKDVPCFIMHFDMSGAIVAELERLTR